METYILNITGLGRLEIMETYVYYNQPVLFSRKNAAGHLYLAVATDKNDERKIQKSRSFKLKGKV